MAQTPAQFVDTHLAHELEYMLMAATTWCACHFHRRGQWPKHLVATAEYAAFVHQRSMFELYCEDSHDARRARRLLCCAGPLDSQVWIDWRKAINAAVAHVKTRWKDKPPARGAEQLKNQVAVFASEHVRLWRNLERCTTSFDVADALRLNRERITAYVSVCALGMGAPAVDWDHPDPFADWGLRKWWPVD